MVSIIKIKDDKVLVLIYNSDNPGTPNPHWLNYTKLMEWMLDGRKEDVDELPGIMGVDAPPEDSTE